MTKNIGNIKLFDLDQIAEMLGVTKVTLRSYIKNGKLKGRKVGIRWYVTEEHLNNFLHSTETKPYQQNVETEVQAPFQNISLDQQPIRSTNEYPHVTTPDQINEPLNFIRFLVETEHELRKHKMSKTAINQISYDLEIWIDNTGRLTYISPMCILITEYSSHEFLNDQNLFLNLIHPGDKETLLKCLKSDPFSAAINQCEIKFFNRSGKMGWLSVYTQYHEEKNRNPIGRRVCIKDITESKLVEEALEHSEERLRYIVDALPVCIFYIDRDFRYRFNNLYFEQLTKFKRNDIYGMHIREVFGDRTFESMRPYLELAFEGKEEMIRAKIIDPFGRVSEQVGKICVDRSDDGTVLGIYGIVMEIRKSK